MLSLLPQPGTSHGSAGVAYIEEIIVQYSGADFLSPVLSIIYLW